jgi:trehalose/maltose hydrolase-like predicted phosphorylase
MVGPVIQFNPHLPKEVHCLGFRIQWRNNWIKVSVSHRSISLHLEEEEHDRRVEVIVGKQHFKLLSQSAIQVDLDD